MHGFCISLVFHGTWLFELVIILGDFEESDIKKHISLGGEGGWLDPEYR